MNNGIPTPTDNIGQPYPEVMQARTECPDGHRLFVGIDGGSSGAMAKLDQYGNWEVCLVSTEWEGGHRLLAVEENLDVLRAWGIKAGGLDHLVVAYEKSRKNPAFGTKNNYVNGRNQEFWRVIFKVLNIQCYAVDPKTWQSLCFKGITCPDTKDRAREYIRRHFPGIDWLEDYNKAPREAIQDAMCIALWAKFRYEASGGRFSPLVTEV